MIRLKRVSLKGASSLLATTIVLLSPATAWAQSGGSAEPDEAISDNDIVVTAQKTSQSLQSVPMAISAVSGDELEARAITNIGDISRAAPSVNLQSTAGATQITIRGVGLQVQTGLAEPNVAVHVDGVFQPAATEADVPVVDLERVEILRGPQGTLYGRNATGGTINFITRKPTPDLEAGLNLGVGSFNARRASGYISGPIAGDSLMGRVSAYYNTDDGYYYNSFLNKRAMGFEKWGVRGALRFAPSSDVTVDLTGYYQEGNTEETAFHTLEGTIPVVDLLIGLGYVPANSITYDRRPWHTTAEVPSTTKFWTAGSTLDASIKVTDGLKLRSITGYVKHKYGPFVYDGDGTNFFISTIGIPGGEGRFQGSESFTQEFNFSGSVLDDKLKYVLGLFYFHEDMKAASPAALGPVIGAVLGASLAPLTGDPNTVFTGLRSDLGSKTNAYAGFADLTYSITPSLRLNLGLRQTSDRKEGTQTNINYIFANGGTIPLAACQNNVVKQKFDHFDYKVRGEADLAAGVMAYGQYQTGFKDGGLNFQVCGDQFQPEKIKSIEFGLKSRTADGSLTLNLSAFHYDYDGLQVLSFIDPTTSFVDNVDKASITGVEVETVLRPSRRFTVNASFAYLDTEVKQFASLDLRHPEKGVYSVAGLPLPSAPKYVVNAGVRYEVPIGANKLELRADTYFTSAYNFRLFNNPEDEQKAYTVTNASVAYTFGSGNYTVRAFVKNLENTPYRISTVYTTISGTVGTYGRPREWGVDASLRF